MLAGGLSVSGGTLLALDDISFEIAPGEILGFVGESGAGKSLTGMAILGLLDPPAHTSAGQIWLGDKRIDSLSQREMRRIRGKEIGAVFQDPLMSLNPVLQIGDQLIETIRTHLPVDREQATQRAPGAEPARNHLARLGPREDPGDGA